MQAEDMTITVAVAQFASVADTNTNIERIAVQTASAAAKDARVVSCPEALSLHSCRRPRLLHRQRRTIVVRFQLPARQTVNEPVLNSRLNPSLRRAPLRRSRSFRVTISHTGQPVIANRSYGV